MKKLLLFAIVCLAIASQARASYCGSTTPSSAVSGQCGSGGPGTDCSVGYSTPDNFFVACIYTPVDMACSYRDISPTDVNITLYYATCTCNQYFCTCVTYKTVDTVWTFTQEAYQSCP